MKLIINLPIDKTGWSKFNKEFAKIQKELVLLEIRQLNIGFHEREKLLYQLKDIIKDRLEKL